MGFAEYIFKVNLVLSCTVLLYLLVFRRLTFFKWNRAFLLASLVLSYLLPLFHWPGGAPLVAAADIRGISWEFTEEVISLPGPVGSPADAFVPGRIIVPVYFLGVLFSFFIHTFRLAVLGRRCAGARPVGGKRIRVFVCPDNSPSFTLFRRIYLGRDVWTEGKVHVLRHEKVHARQLHSLDLIFMNFAGVLLWFNPFVYLLLRVTRENHEYLADAPARSSMDGLVAYLQLLGEESFRRLAPGPVNYFKSSTLKKRIIMLTNTYTNTQKKALYLLTIPLIALLFLAFQAPEETVVTAPVKMLVSEGKSIPSLFPLPAEYKGNISGPYGKRIHPITKKEVFHQGLDFRAPEGTSVYAAAAGNVLETGYKEKSWGRYVILAHGGEYATRYTHLSEVKVKEGEKLAIGQVIATVGSTGQSTGSHLHYEVWKNGEHVNPADYY